MTNNIRKSILLFGGTFDPIHNGHLVVAQYVAKHLGIDKVYIIPAAISPHKLDKKITSGQHRYEMAKLATRGMDLFEVSDCELHRPGASYTFDTIYHFEKKYPQAKLHWLIGADCLEHLHNWYRVDKLVTHCTIVTASRPGFRFAVNKYLHDVLDDEKIEEIRSHIIATPLLDISSTAIRECISANKDCSGMTPAVILEYISQHNLYRN